MEKITKELIQNLQKCNSLQELYEAAIQKQKELKDRLRHKGYDFDDTDKGISGGQRISGEDTENYEAYPEVNFIRLGLSGRWIQHLDEETRFTEIEEAVKNIVREKRL
jgi:predicted proteasome-type protease